MSPTQISHYRLDTLLGEGSFGQVYRGIHVHDEELQVAVKVLRPELIRDEDYLRNLKRECRALDRLDHPGIVRFRELAFSGETVAIVLELLEGEDLETLLAQGPQPLDAVREILQAALEALAYAHGKGVFHRHQARQLSAAPTAASRSWTSSPRPSRAPRAPRPAA